MPNFFFGEDFPENYIVANEQYIFAPKGNKEPHPPGVTVTNCPHRNKGCVACIEELERAGVYQQQVEELKLSLARGAGVPLSEQEANAQLFNSTWQQDQQIQQEYNDAQFIQKFWNAARQGN